jgi:predicted ester cyclase
MSLAANKALAQRWFEEVWNQGKESTIDELFHPQGKAYGFPEPGSVLIGPEAFKTIHRQFHSAFGNIHVHLDDLVAEGDRVAIRWTVTMKHTGDGFGFPATGRDVTLPGSSFITCRDGVMTEGWNSMDMTWLRLVLQSAPVLMN